MQSIYNDTSNLSSVELKSRDGLKKKEAQKGVHIHAHYKHHAGGITKKPTAGVKLLVRTCLPLQYAKAMNTY